MWNKTCLLIFMTTFIIRSYGIEKGNFVTWDEAHFGKFSEKYLTRSFYFDVHPPLGKMLTALSGYIYDQPEGFKFESSSTYPNNFDYTGMRRFHAFVSSFMPVFAYLILKELGFCYKRISLLTTLFIFENGFTSIGRLILLDSHLLTCTSAVIYFMTRLFVRNTNLDLFYLGLSLGLVLSIKWIGFLTMGLVGILIIYRLWNLLNSTCSLKYFTWEFIRYGVCLIVVPVIIYISLFYIHFKIVNKSSPDEGHMSSFFQATLKGNSHIQNRKYVAYGTKCTIRSNQNDGGYLHSHNEIYPNINTNQVTTYTHKDNNNNWVMQKVSDNDKDALFVNHKDEIVLYHLETGKYIDVSGIPAILSVGLLVSASDSGLTISNVFEIEIVEDNVQLEYRLKSITSKFILKHKSTGTYLTRSTQIYPEWGYQQGEIICTEQIEEGSYWILEENISEKIPETVNPVYVEIYKNIFFRNLIEHNILMYKINKSFVQDENLEPDRIISRPYEWPFLIRGLRMCSWDKDRMKFYMFGNPFLWYASTLSTIIGPFIFLVKYIRFRRGLCKFKNLNKESFMVFMCLGGYICHYIPFFFVGRVLYFHHYYPALFFSLMSICYISRYVSLKIIQMFVMSAIYFYIIYSPLTYGFVKSTGLEKLKIVPSWDFIE